MDLIAPRKAVPGDRVAVLSPSFAAPGASPAVHEQGLERLHALTGLVPVEYPTTRRLGASARERADDLNAAFADPGIRAVLATIGGEDQITVVPHLDPAPVRADPKPFLGYSDNTNLLNWLWTTASPASTAAPPRSSSAPARASTRSTSARCAPRCSPVSASRSPSPASPRTSASTGPTRAR